MFNRTQNKTVKQYYAIAFGRLLDLGNTSFYSNIRNHNPHNGYLKTEDVWKEVGENLREALKHYGSAKKTEYRAKQV